MSNPLVDVYDALWRLPEACELFTDLVKPGNRIKYLNIARDPNKKQIAAGDLPEVILAPSTAQIKMHETSHTSKVVMQYRYLISTGDYRYTEILCPVQWALICALIGWKEILGALTWEGVQYVKRADILSVSQGESDKERNRGIVGWSAIWGCEVEMHFPTEKLRVACNSSSSSGA